MVANVKRTIIGTIITQNPIIIGPMINGLRIINASPDIMPAANVQTNKSMPPETRRLFKNPKRNSCNRIATYKFFQVFRNMRAEQLENGFY